MRIQDLSEKQLKSLYCAAMGWQFELNKEVKDYSKFDDFYDKIKSKWVEDRWIITDGYTQIELLEDLFFRCGKKNENYEKGGIVFNLGALINNLKSLKILIPEL